ncbi:HAMP domain-containing histidine kinase [Patescibacteria group bacterium]|nr:HAMP domain-containing histidine kinase [Patescibacteria group bacterium]MBU1247040.1 HAMP domain-containing histidine kinase [Patescibacteria group bacterium]MBU1519741.1 HAMP domain-containing histidine kinase [Patescibacteria group bacterium]MBU1730240.1 HAMP domain-containing histidine kinase [Patescibacteria group bacterium]MBU1956499.1 HAMP domain-containing histidine kinase [Patescibacteria group bacterium]
MIILKKIIYTIGIIGMLSGGLMGIGALDSLLEKQMLLQYNQYIWLAPVIGGVLLYLIGFIVVQKSRRIEETKRKFITIAAHNLRTPLTKVQWLVTSIAECTQEPFIQKRLNDLRGTFKNLTMIINRLLELSESDKTSMYFSYLFESNRLEYIVLQAVADYQVGIEKKNILLNTKIQDNLPPIYADKEKIQLVVNIIIENAILYNNQNGTININIYQKENEIICSIENTGIGISKKNLFNIFTKFYRTADAITKDTDRIGLGLALAKEIIKKHKGEIGVKSEGEGKNTCFWFHLPIFKEK